MHIALLAALLCAASPAASAPAEAAQAPAAATAEPAPAKAPKKKKPGKVPMAGVLNVNRATEAELRLLPGIGKKRAQLVVERRGKKPFASLDDLARVKGMHGIVQRQHAH